jgi:hypothetical protein
MSGNESHTPGWVQLIIYLIIIAALGSATSGHGTTHPGLEDDGCSSGVPQMGCFP